MFSPRERAFGRSAAHPDPDHTRWEPPPADLIEGGGSARRPRTRLAVAALLGAALVGLLLVRPGHPTRPGPSPTLEPAPEPHFAVSRLAFTDAEFGYALLSPCRLSTSPCDGTWSLQRTTDSARHWQRVASPLDTNTATFPTVYARGHHEVALVLEGRRFLSQDAGRTWRTVLPDRSAGPVDAVRAGDEVGYYCPRVGTTCAPRLSAYDPVGGVTRPLRNQPPIVGDPAELRVSGVVAAGQVWLVAGLVTEAPQILHSPDGGRHWQTVSTPAHQDWFDPTLAVAPDGAQVYLITRGGDQADFRRVWRLVDQVNGRWVDAATGDVPLDQIRDIRVLPNGELRYADIAGNAWLTEAHATRVVPAPRALLDGRQVNVNIAQVLDGAVVATPVVGLRGDRILVSTDDGRHWQDHPVPF